MKEKLFILLLFICLMFTCEAKAKDRIGVSLWGGYTSVKMNDFNSYWNDVKNYRESQFKNSWDKYKIASSTITEVKGNYMSGLELSYLITPELSIAIRSGSLKCKEGKITIIGGGTSTFGNYYYTNYERTAKISYQPLMIGLEKWMIIDDNRKCVLGLFGGKGKAKVSQRRIITTNMSEFESEKGEYVFEYEGSDTIAEINGGYFIINNPFFVGIDGRYRFAKIDELKSSNGSLMQNLNSNTLNVDFSGYYIGLTAGVSF